MATIKYKEDEQGNKKIIVKTDPATSQQKVSCGCCACEGCGTFAAALGLDYSVTSISYSWTLTGPVGDDPNYTISGQGTMNISECEATYVGDYYLPGDGAVTLRIIKSVDGCKLRFNASLYDPICFNTGFGGSKVRIPAFADDVILDPNSPISLPFTIPLSVSYQCGRKNGSITFS